MDVAYLVSLAEISAVIIVHLLIEESGYARLEGTEEHPISLNVGDILIIPHRDEHLLENGPPVAPVNRSEVIKQVLLQGLTTLAWVKGGTLQSSQEVGISRSVPAELWRRYLPETPMAYLTRWRLQLSAQMLTSTNSSVAQITDKVGSESEAFFDSVFKREFSLPPVKFRFESKSASRHAPTR